MDTPEGYVRRQALATCTGLIEELQSVRQNLQLLIPRLRNLMRHESCQRLEDMIDGVSQEISDLKRLKETL